MGNDLNFGDYVKQIRVDPELKARCFNPVLDPVTNYGNYLVQELGYNRIWGEYWDSDVFDMNDSNSVNSKLFQTPNGVDGKTYIETNFIGSGIMPNFNAMIVHHVAFGIVNLETSDPATDFIDFAYVQENTYTNIIKNQKLFGEWLAIRIPQGGGNLPYTSNNSAQTQAFMSNGVPGKHAQNRLWIPVVLSMLEQFEVNCMMDPTAFAAVKARHATAQIHYRFILEGEIFRKPS